MALGNEIIIGEYQQGRRKEGIISGTPKPGTVVQVQAGTEPVGTATGGAFTWEVYNRSGVGASGVPWLVGVLDADWLQGMKATDVYVTAKRCFIYFPLPGDELNMLIGDVTGTGATSDFAIGDALTVEDGTGKLIDANVGTSFYVFRPFICMQTYADMVGDTLLYTQFTGY